MWLRCRPIIGLVCNILEDRNLGKPMISFRNAFPYVQLGNLYGIDPHGLMRMPGKVLMYLAGKSSGGGGSTISMAAGA